MGVWFSSQASCLTSAKTPMHFTAAEKGHLIFLKKTAGSPAIVTNINSGNI